MRCAVASASAATSASGDDARDEPLLLRLGCAEDPALEQNLERDVRAGEAHERRHLRIGHDESEILDRRAEAARLAADPKIAQRGDLESAAHADAVNLRDQRMPAGGERAGRRVHDAAVVDRLRLVAALRSRIPRCRCRARTPSRPRRARSRSAASSSADSASIGGAQRVPHRLRQRVELLGAVQHDGRDRTVAVTAIRSLIGASCRDRPAADGTVHRHQVTRIRS